MDEQLKENLFFFLTQYQELTEKYENALRLGQGGVEFLQAIIPIEYSLENLIPLFMNQRLKIEMIHLPNNAPRTGIVDYFNIVLSDDAEDQWRAAIAAFEENIPITSRKNIRINTDTIYEILPDYKLKIVAEMNNPKMEVSIEIAVNEWRWKK